MLKILKTINFRNSSVKLVSESLKVADVNLLVGKNCRYFASVEIQSNPKSKKTNLGTSAGSQGKDLRDATTINEERAKNTIDYAR